jgi:hypothetical protein
LHLEAEGEKAPVVEGAEGLEEDETIASTSGLRADRARAGCGSMVTGGTTSKMVPHFGHVIGVLCRS